MIFPKCWVHKDTLDDHWIYKDQNNGLKSTNTYSPHKEN